MNVFIVLLEEIYTFVNTVKEILPMQIPHLGDCHSVAILINKIEMILG